MIDFLKRALNERQLEAALHTEGPLIVLAGAGSGKTKMLTSRIAYLIEGRGVPPYQILAMTFTNKAAAEMRERVERMLQQAGSASLGQAEIGTFHSVCVRLLRREMVHLPFTRPFVIYDDANQLSLIKSTLNKLGIEEKSMSPKAAQGAINRLKCDAVEPQEVEPSPHDFFEKQLKRVYEQYQKDLFTNNALDFGEIICLTYRLLRDNLEVRQKYQQRFRYLHVDEYQDTNRSQYLLLAMLAGATHGGHQNICVVGDEDQSIYKWRGADINNILDFEADYPGAYVVKLEQNYRSSKTIIRAASEVIRNNISRKDKTLWTENEEGAKIVRAQLPDERAEAEMTCTEIKRLAMAEGRAYADFAIFYRTNAQSRQFEDVLRREKIPYQIVGGLRFYDRKEIKDVLSYFKAIMNPEDSVSLKRIINVPARGIGKTTLEKLDDYILQKRNTTGEEISYWSALVYAATDPSLTSAGTAKKLSVFVHLMERLIAEQSSLLLAELYHLILDETGYVRELRQEGTEESTTRIENMEEFDTLLQEFDEDHFLDLPEEQRSAKVQLLPLFLEQSALASDVDQANRDPAAEKLSTVKLMTLHSSKGLEFPVVFLAGMEEGLFPSFKAWEETPLEDIEEERRLCYVGMTRARHRLYLMHATMRRIWGNTNFADPSRFFNEMPTELIDFRDYAARTGVGTMSRGFAPPIRREASQSVRDTFKRDLFSDDSFQDDVPSFDRNAVLIQAAAPSRGVAQAELIGRRLNHPEYGQGTIIGADGSGTDQKVTIEFRGRQQRKFLFRYVASYVE